MSKPLAKRLYWGGLRLRYKRATPKKKVQLLDELCDLTGMNRKYLIRKLNQKSHWKKRRRGPKPTYEVSIYQPILKVIWLGCDQLCSKKLKAALAEWLPFFEAEKVMLDPVVRQKLLSISPATIDRTLKPLKPRYPSKGSAVLNQAP